MSSLQLVRVMRRLVDLVGTQDSGRTLGGQLASRTSASCIWIVNFKGECQCSRAVNNLSELFSVYDEPVSYDKALMIGSCVLGNHSAYVYACIYRSPVKWMTKRGDERNVKCILKCNTRFSDEKSLNFREFEDFFQVGNWLDADNKIVVLYDSGKNLAIEER